jgi:hypothetical protein
MTRLATSLLTRGKMSASDAATHHAGETSMNVIYHFTSSWHLEKIMQSGALTPTDHDPFDVKCVWGTSLPDGDDTAMVFHHMADPLTSWFVHPGPLSIRRALVIETRTYKGRWRKFTAPEARPCPGARHG